jgi:hypothetical protein
MELILHRMTHLLTHRYQLDKAEVALLLGPFAMWSAAPLKIKKSAAAMAAKIIELLPAVDRLKTSAAARVAQLWAVVHEGEQKHGPSPQSACVLYYTGLLVDTHMAMLWHPRPLLLHELYTLELAPEQIKITSIANDAVYPLTTASIHRLWKTYLTRAPLKPLAKSKKAKPAKNTKLKKGRKRQHADTSSHTLFSTPALPPENRIDITVVQNSADYIKIIDKGMPRSTAARSIATRLKKTVQHQPENNVAIVWMVRKFVLGAYKDATVIATPLNRVKAYSPSTDYLMSIISQLSNKQLYVMVAEYVIGMARSVKTLEHVLLQITEWRMYVKQAHVVCNFQLRQLTVNNNMSPGKGAKIKQGFNQTLTATSALWILAEELGVKRNLQRCDIDAARILSADLSFVYRTFAAQKNDVHIYAAVLLEVGVPKVDIATLENTFRMLQPSDVAAQFKSMLSKMSPGGVAILKLYVHKIIHAASFAVIPIRLERKVRTHPNMLPYVLVCTSCYTTRSQVHNIKEHIKSKDGVEVDTINFAVACTGCGMPGVKMVDLRHNRVMSLNVNDMSTPSLTCLCYMCGRLTRYKHVIGVHEICEPCFKTAQKRVEPKRCVCDISFTNKNNVARTFVALDETGITCLYALCKKHQWVLKHACRPDHNIQFYKQLIENGP